MRLIPVQSTFGVHLEDSRGAVLLKFLVCGLEATHQMFHHPFRMDQLLVLTLENNKREELQFREIDVQI